MNAVFGLVPHTRLRPIHHRIDNLVAAVRGQAMEKDRIALGTRHQSLVDLIGRHRRNLVVCVILPHRHPGVGDDQIGARDRLARVARDLDADALGAGRFDEARVGFIALRYARADVKAEQAGCLDQRRKDIVAVAEIVPSVRPWKALLKVISVCFSALPALE